MYSVYRHVAPNGKVYIGMTKQSPKQRWQNGAGYRTQTRFYRAIQKYGWDSFSHEILFDGLTFEEAEEKEKELILQYQSFDKRFGYNIERGGNCTKIVSDETRAKNRESHRTPEYLEWLKDKNRKRWSDPEEHKKMSQRFSGENNPMFGKKLSEKQKATLAQYNNQPPPPRYGPDNFWYGKHIPDDIKRAISQANSGEKNARARRVCCLETNKVYGCIRDAYRETGIHFASISKCCVGAIKSAGGYHWQYVDETGVES